LNSYFICSSDRFLRYFVRFRIAFTAVSCISWARAAVFVEWVVGRRVCFYEDNRTKKGYWGERCVRPLNNVKWCVTYVNITTYIKIIETAFLWPLYCSNYGYMVLIRQVKLRFMVYNRPAASWPMFAVQRSGQCWGLVPTFINRHCDSIQNSLQLSKRGRP
jgi:hypothetical protein